MPQAMCKTNNEMKDACVKWGKSKIKYCADFMPICHNADLLPESEVTFTPMECIKQGFFENRHAALSSISGSYTAYQEGDIVIAKVTPCFENGNIAVMSGLYSGVGFGSSELFVLRPKKINTGFLFYCLRSEDFINMGKSTMTGTGGLKRVSGYAVMNYSFRVPPLPEQTAIAEYLDDKCAAIDEIIAEAKATIEEYKAWKASVIFEAVTKGLDPNAEMKDSGVEWIGMMPKHWRLSRIKNECINMDYLREPISAENRVNTKGSYDYYGASGVIDKIDDYNVDDTVLLIGEDGANLVYRNLPLVYRASGKFWVNNHAHILKVNEDNDYDFMAFVLESGDYFNYITGSAQPKLSQFNLMRFSIPMPPSDEQRQISKVISKKCATIDAIITEKEALIADMESYKKSLIFEAVTGKRRVAV